MNHLPQIAILAKSLGVSSLVFAVAQNGDDMVENKSFCGFTPRANRILPFSTLPGSEIFSVTLGFPSHVVSEMGNGCEHGVAMVKPSYPHAFSLFGAPLRGVVALALFAWACPLTSGNALASRFIVDFPPKGIVFSHVGETSAFWAAGHSARSSAQIMSGAVEQFSTDETGYFFTSFNLRHGNSDNGVNSAETPLYAFERVRATPSQARQEWREGVTTRAWSPDRTVKPHERTARKGRDSLSYTATYRSVDKEPRDNISDEALNIGENSPISGAVFSIAQYASAVTISGLQVLQNSSKEALIDLLEGRQSVAEAQLQNRIDYDLYQDGSGNGGKDLTGLAAALTVAGTGTYGGIPRATWSFWANQFYRGVTDGGAAVSSANIQSYMTTLGLRCVRGSDMPDLWVGDATYYAFYVNSLQAIQRISSDTGSGTAGAGFPTLKFYGGGMAADVVMGGGVNTAVNSAGTSGGATAARMWALNTKYIFFRPHRDRNFVAIGGERQSTNQDAIVKLIGWAGNLTSGGPQFCGLLSA